MKAFTIKYRTGTGETVSIQTETVNGKNITDALIRKENLIQAEWTAYEILSIEVQG